MALGRDKKSPPTLDVYIAALGREPYSEAFKLCNELRLNNISADMDYQERSLKAQMRQANKRCAKYVSIIGEDELEKGIITIRNMSNGEQREIGRSSFLEEVKRLFKR